MKHAVFTFLNKPALVAGLSLVVAVAIGAAVAVAGNASRTPQFVLAAPGSISVGGQNTSTSSVQSLTLGFLAGGRIQDVSVKAGDAVKKDQVLATLDPENTAGAITQARAAYALATAAYQKVVNGATGPAIDAAKATVNTAAVNLQQVTRQQEVAVANAYTSLLNATPQALTNNPGNLDDAPPTITGSYTLGKEGDIIVETYGSGADSGVSFRVSGLVTGGGSVTTLTPEALGNSGLYIQFPEGARAGRTWIISLPNTKAPDYITKYNAYQAALQAHDQVIASAKAALDQAQSNLGVVVQAARPEDVAAAQAQVQSAQGALQIAQAAYDARVIRAPGDGTVTAVHITPGQIAAPNAPAIDLSGTSFAKSVAVMVPSSAIVDRDGKKYVEVKTATGVEEREITTGISDATDTEVVSGLSAGESVAVSQ
ncbi:MAG: biotin/lipoyl-binding protein [Patescibacteria group bacterium]